MKRPIVAVVLLVFGWAQLREAPKATAAALACPAEIYASNCAKCHGMDGRARTAKGRRNGATDFTTDWNRDEERGIRIITRGKGQMPSFKKDLTTEEIRSVFEFVRKFGKPKQQ